MLQTKIDPARLLQSINLPGLKLCCFEAFLYTVCGKQTNVVPGYGSTGSKEERNYLQTISLNVYVRLEWGKRDVKRVEQVRVLCASSNSSTEKNPERQWSGDQLLDEE